MTLQLLLLSFLILDRRQFQPPPSPPSPLAENAPRATTIGKEEDEAALSLISPVAESGHSGKDNGSSSFPSFLPPLSSSLFSLYLRLRLIFMKTGEIGM